MTGTAIPCLRYKDAHAAINWLCEAFGFKTHLLVPAEDGGVAHAQLVRGSAMVMLASARDDEFGALCASARDAGGSTQSTYFVVDSINAHYRQAVAAGAEIVIELRDEDYGGRGYSAKDPEGNLWNCMRSPGASDARFRTKADVQAEDSGPILAIGSLGRRPREAMRGAVGYSP